MYRNVGFVRTIRFSLLGLGAIVGFISGVVSYAQDEDASDADSVPSFRIDGITTETVKLYENAAPVPGMSPDNSSEFLRISVEYYVYPPKSPHTTGYTSEGNYWIDACTFSWSVAFARVAPGSGTLSPRSSVVMREEITYGNIKVNVKGRPKKRHAVVYVEPRTLERYSSNLIKDGILIRLEIRIEDKTMAKAWSRGRDFVSGSAYPASLFPMGNRGNWFEAAAVTEVQQGLLSRARTPWVWSSYGSYEYIIETK